METDELRYRGSSIPRVIRFAWTVFGVFAAIYVARYLWPDLKEWLNH